MVSRKAITIPSVPTTPETVPTVCINATGSFDLDAIVAYMDGLKLTLPDDVRVAVCPMKQKPWLQEGSDIKNPYYGSSMLTCGDFR